MTITHIDNDTNKTLMEMDGRWLAVSDNGREVQAQFFHYTALAECWLLGMIETRAAIFLDRMAAGKDDLL